MKKQISVYVTDELDKDLKIKAIEEDCKRNDIILKAIEAYLNKDKK